MKLMRLFLFFFTVSTIAVSCSTGGSSNRTTLDAQTFNQQIQENKDIVILDVRTKEEFEKAHVPNAVNINIYEPTFGSMIDNLDKDKKIYVYCLSGSRSGSAVGILANKGFKDIYELEGGLLKWQAAQLPLIAEKKAAPSNMEFTNEQYDEMVQSNELILFDFMADWCGPCKAMAPGLHNIEKDYPDKLKVVKINVDFNQALSMRFQVSSIPAIKIYHKGELVQDIVGGRSEADLRALLNPYLGS